MAILVCSTVIAAYGISCINDVLAITRSDELVTVDIERVQIITMLSKLLTAADLSSTDGSAR